MREKEKQRQSKEIKTPKDIKKIYVKEGEKQI